MSADGLNKLSRDMPAGMGDELILEMREAESDRGAALLGSSIVEHALERLMLAHMVELSPKESAELFQGSGALSNFSGRINASFAFGLINAELRDDLRLMKGLRNAFAHSPQVIDFSHDAIRSRCSRFNALRLCGKPPVAARDQYLRSVQLVFVALKYAAAREELPLPFGMPGMIWATPAPESTKPPKAEISIEQFLRDIERLRPER